MRFNIVEYTENYTKVLDSYKFNKNEISEIIDEIIKHRKKLGFKVTRNKNSYVHQWMTYNRLYKLGYQRKRTKDIKFEENIKAINQSLYNLLGR